mmetsp:Transcript_21284/g.23691  ORF Transcript_21284/g.23691 Transcript_21284/m.23691 type:complete len:155 (+) Transcript_21284:204-668(+)
MSKLKCLKKRSQKVNNVNLLFAGKVLDDAKTLIQHKLENNYVIHAIFKKNLQPVISNDNSEEVQENENQNIMQFADFLQRAAVVRQQQNRDNNDRNDRNDLRAPPRLNAARSSLFNAQPNNFNLNEDDSSKCIKEIIVGLFVGFLFKFLGVVLM